MFHHAYFCAYNAVAPPKRAIGIHLQDKEHSRAAECSLHFALISNHEYTLDSFLMHNYVCFFGFRIGAELDAVSLKISRILE